MSEITLAVLSGGPANGEKIVLSDRPNEVVFQILSDYSSWFAYPGVDKKQALLSARYKRTGSLDSDLLEVYEFTGLIET